MSEITITAPAGSSVPGCENTEEGCFIPSLAIVELGEFVDFVNADTASHTFTAGIIEEGLTGEFGHHPTGFVLPRGATTRWIANVVREIPYFCMYHPWSKGVLIVKPKSTQKDTSELKM